MSIFRKCLIYFMAAAGLLSVSPLLRVQAAPVPIRIDEKNRLVSLTFVPTPGTLVLCDSPDIPFQQAVITPSPTQPLCPAGEAANIFKDVSDEVLFSVTNPRAVLLSDNLASLDTDRGDADPADLGFLASDSGLLPKPIFRMSEPRPSAFGEESFIYTPQSGVFVRQPDGTTVTQNGPGFFQSDPNDVNTRQSYEIVSDPAKVSEPPTLLLLIPGLAGLGTLAWRRRLNS